jgi:D-alanyl-D-alanine carboxypeptidase/D-alanyl-D-alanine-endopeptidase (penicillin-binding protein 4)
MPPRGLRTFVMPVRRHRLVRAARLGAPALAALLALALLPAAAPARGLPGTQRLLAREMAAAGAAGAYVVDLDSGDVLFSWRPRTRRIPASVTKLFTTATALRRFRPDGTLQTDVLADAAPGADGVLDGNVYLKGGGDPSFGSLQARRLARRLARTGLDEVSGRVIGDESAWDTLRGGPSTGYRLDGWLGPLSALAFDHGLTGGRYPFFQVDPARFAAGAFTRALRRAHVRVRRSARAGVAPADAQPLMSWSSPDIATLVARTNTPSDNYMAEGLLKALGARFGLAGSTGAGVTVVRATVEKLGARPRLVDGSGLSRGNAVSPRDVVRLIVGMDRSALAEPFEASLAVAGRTGTLSERLRYSVARGRCRAKTGTLSGVSALAGICDTTRGRRVAFAFLMNRVSVYWAHVRQDRMTAALARYG